MAPFQALYGRKPHAIPDFIPGSTDLVTLQESLQLRQEVITLLKRNLKKSRQQMEVQSNKKRRDFTFNTGDLVLLRLQPYRQTTVHRHTSQKLSQRFFGPFKVQERIGSVAYRLDLPLDSKIHPVVHISLLRPYYGDAPNTLFQPLPHTPEHEHGEISQTEADDGKVANGTKDSPTSSQR